MAEIILNGRSVKTEAADMKDLKRQTYASEGLSEDIQRHCVWIVEGFQTDENLSLKDGMTINWIRKGKMPDREEMESMLCARHTPHVYEKAKKARVAIAGLGGLGSNIAIMLARTGIGHLHLIDFDVVDITNLNRQQYFIDQIGMYKTDALKSLLERINPYLDIRTDTVKVTEENLQELFADAPIVCEAFDRPEAKAMLVNGILEHFPEKKLVSATGMAGYGSSNTIRTQRLMKNFYLCGDRVSEPEYGRGLMAARVAVCAAHEANMITRLILGEEEA